MAKVSIDRASLDRVLAQLTKAVEESLAEGIKNGLFHLPSSDRNALWVATDLLQKSGKFPNYKFTFYHLGKGAETNTCAVTFIASTIDNIEHPNQ
ncbi:hypothetical protein Syn7502_02455 [Synechococcus sp. PCC 7502]|uniref:hypothetical protein n=1 Tax=Synechococcus sp. PCC 7502 TaxID=1173263 RepID=UPI00029FF68A|nr:hypothetical protein [Synechococcus sp. PCC 7502]AFY74436.1 hypothetical protein Syn7502_02455 [Synechococcus sp. PCC 7502]